MRDLSSSGMLLVPDLESGQLFTQPSTPPPLCELMSAAFDLFYQFLLWVVTVLVLRSIFFVNCRRS